MKEKTQSKEIKRKSLNIDYDLARKLELKAAEMETTQTELINMFIEQGLKRMENQKTMSHFEAYKR